MCLICSNRGGLITVLILVVWFFQVMLVSHEVSEEFKLKTRPGEGWINKEGRSDQLGLPKNLRAVMAQTV